MFSSNTSQVSNDAVFVEDVFSTWLYTGNGSTQTITNGIDLAGKGGLYWWKVRNIADQNYLVDTARGATKWLISNNTGAEQTVTTSGLALNSNGVSFNNNWQEMNLSGNTYASWTFRKQPKFFDVVTWTGNSTANRAIAHSLGSTPGCIIVKKLDSTVANTPWCVWHRSLAAINAGYFAYLNTTDPYDSGGVFNVQLPTSTEFYVGNNLYSNYAGSTYVAYVFAHNAGGFGLTGTDNVISCGSFTTDASGNGTFQNLGYEPQWVMVKNITSAEDWVVNDNMRGMRANPAGSAQALFPNTSGAEVNYGLGVNLGATGFTGFGSGSKTYIYIAIRRGPMKTPTSGTSVYAPIASGDSTGTQQTTGFPVDAQFTAFRSNSAANTTVVTRLTGVNSPNLAIAYPFLLTSATNAESTAASRTNGWGNTGFLTPSAFASNSAIYWNFRRAPGFFDEVCYTGNGVSTAYAHNLGVQPGLLIVKVRSAGAADPNWYVIQPDSSTAYRYGKLNTADDAPYMFGSVAANITSTTFNIQGVFGSSDGVNESGRNYVAHLFASCPGVSKVGTYTGNGSSQTINCGFTGGARFFLVKRADSTGDWYVFDSARGIVGAGDPFLRWNLTNGEQTGADAVDADSSGIIVNQEATCNINVNGATYIYLAIA